MFVTIFLKQYACHTRAGEERRLDQLVHARQFLGNMARLLVVFNTVHEVNEHRTQFTRGQHLRQNDNKLGQTLQQLQLQSHHLLTVNLPIL